MNRLLCLIPTLLLAAPAWAGQQLTPEDQIKNLSNEVLAIIHGDKDLQTTGDTAAAIAQIDTKVLQPHFNFKHMTSLSMGKEWRKASPDQQQLLVKEFKTLLVRTYSNALTIYKDPTVKIKPSRYQPSDTEVQIRTQVIQTGIKPVDIDYTLEKIDNSWQVFDVVVAGVSLVTNYRDFFGQEVRKGGVEGAIKSLQVKNQSLSK
jgi:phospholipid transport system substrate-binding protein